MGGLRTNLRILRGEGNLARSNKHRAFRRHHLALVVANPNATADTLRQETAEIAEFGPSFYTDFLPSQGLSSS